MLRPFSALEGGYKLVKFMGAPHLLVNVNPPIGEIKHIRFDANGEFVTDNERLIRRMHHQFDSMPAGDSELTEAMTDDLEQTFEQAKVKVWSCNQCEFKSENKGVLMAHKKAEHPKE